MTRITQKGGNAVLNVILWIFAIVGIVAIVYLVIVYVTTSASSSSTDSVAAFPPNSYMTTSGLKCPDYWIKVSESGGKVRCRNAYQLPMNSDTCTDSEQFSVINSDTWTQAEDKTTLSGVTERCSWINRCGGVWQGVQDYC